jgi:signal transduction histidine kinase
MASVPERATMTSDATGTNILEVLVIVTLGLGYVLSLIQASALDLPRFLLTTATHAAWYVVFRLGARWSVVPYAAALIALSLVNGALILVGLNWDWLIGLMTIGVLATCLSFRQISVIAGSLFVLMMGVFFLAFGLRNSLITATQVAPAYVFVVGFVTVARRAQDQRERAETLLAELTTSQQELQAAHARLAAYAGDVEALSITRERNRLAREIHDTLGHSLTILAIKLETALHLQERGDPSVGEEISETLALSRRALADVRHSVAALRLEDPPRSLCDGLRLLVSEYAAACPDMDLSLDADPPPVDLTPEVQLALVRVAQEALTNVRKHSHATKTLVRLRFEGHAAYLTVLDNGVGQAASEPEQTPGFGLVGMRERLALLGGAVNAGPATGQGWRVEATIPLVAPS